MFWTGRWFIPEFLGLHLPIGVGVCLSTVPLPNDVFDHQHDMRCACVQSLERFQIPLPALLLHVNYSLQAFLK